MQNLIVFSDYICPFCFIGKRRAEQLSDELPLQLVWKGFEIHPEVPPEGIPLNHFMPEMLQRLETSVRVLSEETGLEMRMPEKLSNSHLALLGAEYSREAGNLEDYNEAVFSAYFQNGEDIGDIETLVEIWDKIGDDSESFRNALKNEHHTTSLRASQEEARKLGLSGVPSFIFDNGTIIVGAQPDDVLKAAAEKSLRLSEREQEK